MMEHWKNGFIGTEPQVKQIIFSFPNLRQGLATGGWNRKGRGHGGHIAMKKILLALIGLSFFMACAAGRQTQPVPQGVVFETGKRRQAVMDAIVQVGVEDGYAVGSISQEDGVIVFKPRKMLDGILSQKISGRDWNMQTKSSTLNHLIQFSAGVSQKGVVELKAFVVVSGLNGPVDSDRSEKLGRYYEQKIMRVLRTPLPKLLMRITATAA
jgi:hypothetical protein